MSEEPKDHPEHVNPLGESHPHYSAGEKRSMRVLSLGLVLGLVAVPILAVTSFAPMGNVLLGLSPYLVTIALELGLVANQYRRHVLWFMLILVHMFALGFLYTVNPVLSTSINVGQSVSISVLLSGVFTLLAFLADNTPVRKSPYRMPPPEEFSVEKLPEFVQSIEDKAKALNFAIGRVYRTSNGGTAKIRARLRIPREWYNEFNEAEEEERVKKAEVIVKKIHDRLLLLKEKEKDIFSVAERKRFKNLKRDMKGGSVVLDILNVNDSDPVGHYHESALQFCDVILHGLK